MDLLWIFLTQWVLRSITLLKPTNRDYFFEKKWLCRSFLCLYMNCIWTLLIRMGELEHLTLWKSDMCLHTFFVTLDLAAVIASESHRSSCRNRQYSNPIYVLRIMDKRKRANRKSISSATEINTPKRQLKLQLPQT